MTDLLQPPHPARQRSNTQIAGRWLRRAFTRDRIIQSLKTLAWVAPLTALVWIWAESEQVFTDKNIEFIVAVRSNNPQRVVTLRRPAEGIIIATLEGPRTMLDAIEAKLPRGAGSAPLELVVGSTLNPGPYQSIQAQNLLRSCPLFRDSGVNITTCEPETLVVDVDELVHRLVTVKVDPSVKSVVGQCIFEPASVTVSGPRTALEAAFPEGKNDTYADLAGLLKVPGLHENEPVPVSPGAPTLSVDPPTVRATVTVRESDVERVYPQAIPIWVEGPPSVLSKYHLEIEGQPDGYPKLDNIRLKGPPDKMDLLFGPEFNPKPTAILVVTSDDVSSDFHTGHLKIDVPPNMGITPSVEDSAKTVRFRLVDNHPTE